MSAIEPYGLDPDFERTVGVLCASSPRFWGSVGYALDVEALGLPEVKLIVRAAKEIAKETGRGPSNAVLVVQRMRRWVDEGGVTLEQVHDVMDLLLDTPEPPPHKEVSAEIAPLVQRRMQQDVVRVAMEEYSKRGDFERVEKMMRSVKRVGTMDTSEGMRLGLASFSEMDRLKNLDRLPLGIPEVDLVLDGGLPRGTETVFVAAPGNGKSMLLGHVAANALRRGLFVVYATLELPEVEIMARIKANLTGVPTTAIKAGEYSEAKRIIRKLIPTLGTFLAKSFPAKATSVGDIRDWVQQAEEAEGYAVDVVVVDYGQKLRSNNKDDKNVYEQQGTIYEDFRLWMEATSKWGFTASQAKRRDGKEKGRALEIDDIAESMKQVHVADLVMMLNNDKENNLATFGVKKWRYGQDGMSVGPLPTDFACGRICILEDA